MSVWDQFRDAANTWKPENPGDNIVGTIVGISVTQSTTTGKNQPRIILKKDDGEEIKVYASQVQLQRKLAAEDPKPGDRLAIVFTHVEALEAGKTMKHFDVTVKRGEAATAGSVAAPSNAPAANVNTTSAADLI